MRLKRGILSSMRTLPTQQQTVRATWLVVGMRMTTRMRMRTSILTRSWRTLRWSRKTATCPHKLREGTGKAQGRQQQQEKM